MKRDAGFSLVEVLCALLILGAGVVGITESIALSLRLSGEAEEITRAAQLAASRLEILRLQGYLTEGEEEGEFDEFPRYRWSQTITETQPKGLFEVTVAVALESPDAEGASGGAGSSQGDAGGGEPLYELKTLLFQKPFTSTFDSETREKDARKDRRGNRRGGGGRR